MFPVADPTIRLELHHQHVNELIQEATVAALARSARRRRRRRLPWRAAPARVTATT